MVKGATKAMKLKDMGTTSSKTSWLSRQRHDINIDRTVIDVEKGVVLQ